MNKIIAVVLAVVLFFLLAGYDVKTYRELAAQVPNPLMDEITTQQGFARDLLDEDNQLLYDAVKTGLTDQQPEIEVRRKGYTEQDAVDVLWAIRVDSPEIFWVEWKNWTLTTGSDSVKLKPSYFETGTARDEKERLLNEAVSAVALLAAEAGAATDYDKVLFVHDYLIDNVDYLEEGPSDIHTAYGALVDKVAVCDGYAHAFQLLLRQLEVECLYVEGYTKGSAPDVGHAWNMVNIGGNYHLVDVTWDDADLSNEENWDQDHLKSYWYFLLSTEDLAMTHTDTSPYAMPHCDSYGFFASLGLSGAKTEDFRDTIINIATANAQKDIHYVEFEITDPDGYEYIRENSDTELGPIVNGTNALLEENGSDLRYRAARIRAEELSTGWRIRLLFVIDDNTD